MVTMWLSDKYWSIKTQLCHAALSGDYETANAIFSNHREIINNPILSVTNETTLHVAAGANQTQFVEELLNKYHDIDFMTAKDCQNNTVFYSAIAAGASDIVEKFLSKYEKNLDHILRTPDDKSLNPLSFAALFGHEKIVSKLHEKRNIIKPSQEEQYVIFWKCTENDLYGK